MDRPFLDANVLFSAGYKDTSPLRKLWGLPETELLTSAYAAEEACRNLAADKPGRMDSLKQLLDAVTIVAGPSPAAILPEGVNLPAKDQPILLAAIEATATHLLTGDKDHFGGLYGQTVGGVLVLRPRDYINLRAK
jgi:uncharacterized protein